MAMPDRCGDFMANVVSHGLAPSKSPGSSAVQWVAVWALKQWYDPTSGEWCDYSAQDAQITGYHTIVGRDGCPHARGLSDVQEALGLPPITSLDVLDGTIDYSAGEPARIKVSMKTDNKGQQRMEVQLGSPTLKVISPDEVKKLNNMLSTKLRAIAPKAAPAAPGKALPAVAKQY